ncbi:MAG: calcium-binding protein [Cyanobacteria bacterium RM1_2_2]|nr:calcium-binding protein [Cyanobacteria bacterium RM1_2_2]
MSVNPSTSDFHVNTYISGEQVSPDIAIGSLGNFVITWQSEDQDGDGEGIFARIYNASAVPVSPEFRVNTTTQNDQSDPAVAVDASNNFVVVWSSDQQTGGFSGQDVYAQRFNSAGSPLGTEFRVNRSIQQDQANPDVASDALGNFIVVYESEQQDANTIGQDTSGTGIFAQRFDRNGALLGAEFRVNTRTENDQTAPVVAINSQGDFVVVWVSDRQDGSGAGIFGQRYNSSGLAVGAEFQVGTETDGDQTNPAVAIDDSGSFVVAWQSDDQDDDGDGYGIYAQRFSTNGNPDRQILVNSTTDGDQVNPAVASDASGNFTVVWASDDQDGDEFGIFGQRFLQSGRRQGGEFQVNRDGDENQTRPAVAVTSASDAVVIWQSDSGSNDQQDIFGRVTVNSPEIRGTSGDNTLQGTPQADRISGLQGDDTLRGVNGDDVLKGGAGDDRLEGGNGNDNLQGGDNDDTLDGGEGNDTLAGGVGADVFVLQQKRGDTLIRDFEDGIDKLGLSAGLNTKNIQLEQRGSSTVVSWNGIELATLLGTNTQQITQGDFERASRAGRRIRGTNQADTLNGTGGSDVISGLQRGDTLKGGGGDDEISGDNGNDLLLGQAGDDSLAGGNNNDTLNGGVGDDFLEAGNGNDVLIGGKGADIFFLERKTGTTIIEDFQDGVDVFSFLKEDINSSQITFQQIGADTAIKLSGQQLALVKNISVSQLSVSPSDFISL